MSWPDVVAKNLCAALVLASVGGAAQCADLVGRPDDYVGLVKRLRPGDRLSLEPGFYLDGLKLHGIEGQKNAPIVIEGPAAGPRAVFLGRDGANTVSIANASHLVIRNLELDGRNLPVDAVKAEGTSAWAHHITLEGLRIVNHGDEQHTVGISTKCPAWGWVIRGNEIIGAGTGIYLGGSRGGVPFVDGLIEYNLIVGTLGYNLQIKHQIARPAIDGLPVDARRTVIRHNVFAKGVESSTGPLARPNVLIGHLPVRGAGADDDYLVYGNLFHGNPTEVLFQGEGNIALYDNVFVNPNGAAVAILPHNDVPRAVRVFHNTVLASGAGIRFVGYGSDARQYVGRNIVFAQPAMEGVDARENVVGTPELASGLLENPNGRLGEDLRLWPKVASGPVSGRAIPALPGSELDFDGNPRAAGDVGAYAKAASRRWKLELSRKPSH